MTSYLEDERKVYSVLKADENTYAIEELKKETRMPEEKILYVLSRLIKKGRVIKEDEEHLFPEKRTIDVYRVSKGAHITKGRIPPAKQLDTRRISRLGEDFDKILNDFSEVSPEALLKEFTI